MSSILSAMADAGVSDARWIGLDMSLTKTGWAVKTPAGLMLWGILKPPPKVVGSPRLDFYDREFAALCQHPWDLMGCEGYSFGNKFTRDHDLGEQGGLLRLNAYRAGRRLMTVAPSLLKKYATGVGKGSKGVMIKAVFKRWSLDVDTDDEADAVAVCQMVAAKSAGTLTQFSDRDMLDKAPIIEPLRSVQRVRVRPAQ